MMHSPTVARPKPKVALLTNQMWPQWVPMWEVVQEGVGEFKIFVSTLKEPNRRWRTEVGSLNIVTQKSITLASRWRHPLGFSDDNYIHLPVDTYAELKAFRPDVIISYQLGFRTLMAVLYKILNRRTTLVFRVNMTEHQQRGAGGFRRLVRRLLIKYADWVIANGHSALRVMTSLGFPEDRITIVPSVCSLAQFEQVEPARGWDATRKLVYVGRLVDGKGLLPFLAVLNQVVTGHPELFVEMNLVGYGDLAKKLAEFRSCDRLKVVLRGALEVDERHEAYRYGQVFVFPSLSDEWGLVVNEAMAAGLPICGSCYSQAVTELVDVSREGWIFDPFQEASVRGALESLLFSTEEQIAAMGRNAKSKIAGYTPALAGELTLGSIASACGKN